MKWFESLSTNIRKGVSIVLMFIGMFGLFFASWSFKLLFIALLILSFYVFLLDSKIEQEKKKEEEEKRKQEEIQHYRNNLTETASINVTISSLEKYSNYSIEFPIYTKARGVTFEGRQELLEESSVADDLIIEHRPTKKYPERMIIINKSIGEEIGNVSADLARALVEEYGEGCKFYGMIADITGGEDKRYLGCNFSIDGVEYD